MLRVPGAWLVVVVGLGLAMLRVSAWSYMRGYQAAEAVEARALVAAEARLERTAAVARRAEAARLATEVERDALSRQLEDMAHADPDSGRIAFGADSVRRLNRR